MGFALGIFAIALVGILTVFTAPFSYSKGKEYAQGDLVPSKAIKILSVPCLWVPLVAYFLFNIIAANSSLVELTMLTIYLTAFSLLFLVLIALIFFSLSVFLEHRKRG